MAGTKSGKRKTVIADASSLILLAKSELLESILTKLDIIVPEEVYEEAVVRGKAKGHADAFQLETFFNAKQLQTKSVGKENIQRIQKLFNLSAGERDALALAQQLGVTDLLIDDKKGINACRALGLRFNTALDLVVGLRKQGIITKAKAFKVFGQLEVYGWYAKTLLQQARSDIDAT